MKNILLCCAVLIFVSSCAQRPQEKTVLAKVNNYEITKDEFEEELARMGFSKENEVQAKEDFLNNLINRKLILQDAQRKGLDKQEGFLRMIERFWEQSLLKLALDKKTKEISSSVSVDEEAVKDAYDKLIQEAKADKPYEQMYEQIKWELGKSKETELTTEWINELRKGADIKINSNLLDTDK